MKTLCSFIMLGTGALALVGCRSPNVAEEHKAQSATALTVQMVALSNDVARVSKRLEALEQRWNDMMESVEPLLEMLDEIRSQPVVDEALIGVGD